MLQSILVIYSGVIENRVVARDSKLLSDSNAISIYAISIALDSSKNKSDIPNDVFFSDMHATLEAGTYWVKIELENTGPFTEKALLIFPSNLLNIISYQRTQSGDTLTQSAGLHQRPKDKRYVLNNKNIIWFEASVRHTSKVYLHLTIPEGSQQNIRPEVQSLVHFQGKESLYRSISITFTAIFIILGIYNLLLHFILSERGFLFYSIMVLGYALHASLPLLYHILNIPSVSTLSILAASFIVFSGAHFSIHFLKVARSSIWNKALRFLATINIGIVFLLVAELISSQIFSPFNKIASLIAAISALILMMLWLSSAISVWRSNDIRGKYFLLINIPILISGLIFTVVWMGGKYGFIPRVSDIAISVNLIFYSGVVIQLVAFSLVFGYHIRGIENEKLEIQTKLNKELEEKVQLRTENLEIANEKISEQKNALERSNDLKDKLFTIISHDLKSPLNSLKGILELFKSDALPPNLAKEYLGKINNTLSHTTSVMDNLLHWSKSQMTGIQVSPEYFQINELIDHNIQVVQPLIEDKKIDISLNLFPQQIYADQNMIDIVVRNLISNAIKFTHVKGVIEIAMSKNEGKLLVSVKDNGVGMTNDEISQLFQIKNHRSSAGTLNEKGTGLGLILSQEFIRHNGGDIKVKSEVDKGATFIFSLPLQVHPQP